MQTETISLDADGPPPEFLSPPDVGDTVWVVFWRPTATVYQPKAGVWDTVPGTLVSAGARKVCYELSNPSLPAHFGGDGVHGSPLRFVPPDRVFRDRDAATEAAKLLPPPAQ